MIFSCFELGAAGAISAILSVFPEESCMMWKYAGEGKHDEGIRLQNSLYKSGRVWVVTSFLSASSMRLNF